MRAAFVLRLGRDSKPADQHLEGWVEDVNSGKEARFHSTEELFQFLKEHFLAVGERHNNVTKDSRNDDQGN
jgi:hypothetical protein